MKDSCWSFLTLSILDLAVSSSLQWGHPLSLSIGFIPEAIWDPAVNVAGPFFTLHLELPLSQAAVFLLAAQALVT